jgi:hypothetical protein
MYVWQGKGSNATERKTATSVAGVLKGSRTLTAVEEGKEPADFWTRVGGKGDYPTERELTMGAREPRLFRCSTNGGHFFVEEIFNFSQDDLLDDDVMILDTYSEVFVWVGSKSSAEEKNTASKTALDFVENSPDGRSKDTPIYRIHPGNEPANFTCHFLGWNPTKSAVEDPYLAAKARLSGGAAAKTGEVKSPKTATSPTGAAAGATPAKAAAPERVTADNAGFVDHTKKSFSLDDLKNGRAPNIDPSNKPLYLADAEFLTVMKMTKADFIKLPKWKADGEKRKVGLF